MCRTLLDTYFKYKIHQLGMTVSFECKTTGEVCIKAQIKHGVCVYVCVYVE